MFSYEVLDEAPLRLLTEAELTARNNALRIRMQPEKKGSDWAWIGVQQYGDLRLMGTTQQSDAVQLDSHGRARFDTSSAQGRSDAAKFMWLYMGFSEHSPQLPAFSRRLLAARRMELTLDLAAPDVVKWVTSGASEHLRSAVTMVRDRTSLSKMPPLRSTRLSDINIEAHCKGMIIDYERTSGDFDDHYAGTVTVLHGGRQHRFEGASWPRPGGEEPESTRGFFRTFTDFLGMNYADRLKMNDVLRERLDAIFSSHQAYYNIEPDIKVLVSRRNRSDGYLAPTDEVVVPDDFVVASRKGLSTAYDQRGPLRPAVKPVYVMPNETGWSLPFTR